MEIKKLTATTFVCESDSGKQYQLEIKNDGSKKTIVCSCKAFVFKGRVSCKHTEALAALLKSKGADSMKAVKRKELTLGFNGKYEEQIKKAIKGVI